jgi:hypothetical protein
MKIRFSSEADVVAVQTDGFGEDAAGIIGSPGFPETARGSRHSGKCLPGQSALAQEAHPVGLICAATLRKRMRRNRPSLKKEMCWISLSFLSRRELSILIISSSKDCYSHSDVRVSTRVLPHLLQLVYAKLKEALPHLLG